MSTTALPKQKPIGSRRFAPGNDRNDVPVEVMLRFSAQTFRLLEEMCENGEAISIPDAVGRLMSIGVQARGQFSEGFTEVIFQNPRKQIAYGIDLYSNLKTPKTSKSK